MSAQESNYLSDAARGAGRKIAFETHYNSDAAKEYLAKMVQAAIDKASADLILEAAATERKLRAEIAKLKERIQMLRSGHEGACYACEPVGELNQLLSARLDYVKRAFALNDAEIDAAIAEDAKLETAPDAYSESEAKP